MGRRAARVDENQSAIVDALRKCGMKVLSLASIGKGCPDLLVYSKAKGLLLIEVKNPKQAPSARKLKPLQKPFHAEWPVWIIESESEAIALAGGIEQ